jgi:hypothetical protein
MPTRKTGTREEWLAARLDLLRRRRSSRGAATMATVTTWRGRFVFADHARAPHILVRCHPCLVMCSN